MQERINTLIEKHDRNLCDRWKDQDVHKMEILELNRTMEEANKAASDAREQVDKERQEERAKTLAVTCAMAFTSLMNGEAAGAVTLVKLAQMQAKLYNIPAVKPDLIIRFDLSKE